MNYADWEREAGAFFEGDPLWKMTVYRRAMFAADLAWPDVSRLYRDPRTVSLSDQLYRAVGSIGANVSEGYSRISKRDRARFYEDALGSARESRGWYFDARHVLGDEVFRHRRELLTEIIRLLLTIIPAERTGP